jgi:methylmalonyl-CoA mutase C-terminal domain/subunit
MTEPKQSKKNIRVLLAKGGTDAHTVGIITLARSFKDAGMEVIFAGLYLSPEEIVSEAISKDVDVLGISQLDGNHMGIFIKVRKLLDEKEAKQILFIGGGMIPRQDVEELKKRGIDEFFLPGTPVAEIIDYIKAEVGKRAQSEIKNTE